MKKHVQYLHLGGPVLVLDADPERPRIRFSWHPLLPEIAHGSSWFDMSNITDLKISSSSLSWRNGIFTYKISTPKKFPCVHNFELRTLLFHRIPLTRYWGEIGKKDLNSFHEYLRYNG